MGVKKIIGVKEKKKLFSVQIGVKKLLVSNGCKNILGIKWV